MFRRILIANRGEIACRVIRTAQSMGIHCIAVYSEADTHSLHVEMADEAWLLGPSPARESYLRIDKIIEIARESGAEAIHPGYGFLAENTNFARACEVAGIVFIGPGADAIDSMGSKRESKLIMEKTGVPMVPSFHEDERNPKKLKAAARKIGYPVLLKAVAGGGGKGMRIVRDESGFDEALEGAKREALSSFSNDDMLIEKYLERPRHVEVQVFADTHGNAVYLSTRDCSVQRRHQKIIEEAPAPGLSDELRIKIGETAVKAARAINYVNAGTVEFLLDEDGSFYFMEMNTRLQVEHPATEMITGLDLVEWQLIVASGGTLPLAQNEIKVDGHSLEVRIYAEDPDHDFLPSTGTLSYLRTPSTDRYVRIDTGVREGDKVTVYYDPLIAKLIVWDENRSMAISRLLSALMKYRVTGLRTNIGFLSSVASTEPFREGKIDTAFIPTNHEKIFPSEKPGDPNAVVLAGLFVVLKNVSERAVESAGIPDPYSPWNICSGWRMNVGDYIRVRLARKKDPVELTFHRSDKGYKISWDGNEVYATGILDGDKLTAVLGNSSIEAFVVENNGIITVFNGGFVTELTHFRLDYESFTSVHASGSLTAPMNGTIVKVNVEPGAMVNKGDTLLIVEAMKMEHSILAPEDGTVGEIFFRKGDLVADGVELISFTSAVEQE